MKRSAAREKPPGSGDIKKILAVIAITSLFLSQSLLYASPDSNQPQGPSADSASVPREKADSGRAEGPEQPAGPGSYFFSSDLGCREKTLRNGLVALAKEERGTGLVSIDLTIRCGSALEGDRLGSGISHLVEHMVFKGTRTRPAGQIEREIKSLGAIMNASTSYDVTSFQATTPPESLSKVVELLRDMVENAAFVEGEFSKEKAVVLSEIAMNNDDPQREVSRLLWETAYLVHPYRHPVIGHEELFRNLTRDDAVRYYHRMYVPNRMVLAVVGDVDKDIALGMADDLFGGMKMGSYESVQIPLEPRQLSPRYREAPFETTLAYIAFGYHSTRLLDDDLYAADVLALIMGYGDSSRLNKTLLKEKRLVHAISAYNYTPADPGLFLVTAMCDGALADRVVQAVRDEISRAVREPVTNEELGRAKKTVVAHYLSSRQTTQGVAEDIALNRLLTGSHDFSSRYVKGVEAVTQDDIKRVARTYLNDRNLTVVKLIPKRMAAETKPAEERSPLPKPGIVRETFPNGLTAVVRENSAIPMAAVTVGFRGGVEAEDARTNGISNLVAHLLLRGTATRSEDEITGAIESLGGSIEAFSGLNSFGFTFKCLKSDIEFCVGLAKDIAAHAVFPEDQVERERALVLAQIQREDDDIFDKGILAFRKALYAGRPYSLRIAGEEGTIGNLKREELVDFYRTRCVSRNMVISISGDVEARATLDMVRTLFSDMPRAEAPPAPAPHAARPSRKSVSLNMDKEEGLALAGYETVAVGDPKRYAFEVLGSILSGANGRIFAHMRGERGLAYGLGVAQAYGVEPGYFVLYAATTKDKVALARKMLLAEIEALYSKGVTDAEIECAKRELVTMHRTDLQTNEFASFHMALDELYGLGYESLYRYDEHIALVTKAEVAEVIKKYMDPGACTEAIVNEER